MTTNQQPDITYKALVIWCAAASFTVFQLFLEMLTNTMVNGLIFSFHINHADVGILSSTFFYTFLAMQIPVGILLEKYKINYILAFTCAGCGIGCLLFSQANSFVFACISRFVMGGFAAFGFLGLLKVTSIWFPSRMFPLMIGFSQFLVMILTAFGEPLAAHCVSYYGWREVMATAGYTALMIALMLFVIVKHNLPKQMIVYNNRIILSKIVEAITNKECWFANIFGFGMFSVAITFSALWGLSFLMAIYQLTRPEAALGISLNFAGIAVGCALFGFFSSYLRRTVELMKLGALLSLLLMIIIILLPTIVGNKIFLLLFLLGIFNGSFFLSFDIVKKNTHADCNGIAIAVCNIFVMSGAVVLQPIMGFIIDSHSALLEQPIWWRAISGSYTISMMPLILMLGISFFVTHFMTERNNQERQASSLEPTLP